MRKHINANPKVDYRVVRAKNELIAPVVGEKHKYIYSLCECHYNDDGKIEKMYKVDELAGYSRVDVTEFFVSLGTAMMKPVIDEHGNECDGAIMPQTNTPLGINVKKKRRYDR